MRDATKFARGTVWWCEDPLGRQIEGVQSGKRPALIISTNDRGNSPVVEVVKLTLSDKSNICPGINVPLTYHDSTSYILCNQHYTVHISTLIEYMYTVSSEVMSQVDIALLRAQGMEDLIKFKENQKKGREIDDRI